MRKSKEASLILRRILFNSSVKFFISFLLIYFGVIISGSSISQIAKQITSIPSYFLLLIGLWMTIIGFYLLVQATRYSKLENMFLSLDYWVNKNDIGNATNLVSSLSENENIKKYFDQRLNQHKKGLLDKNYFYMINEQSYLVGSIQELVKEIDSITLESLLFLKIYTEFEPKNRKFQEKIVNSVLGMGFFGGVLACYKYGIDLFIKKDTKEIGLTLIIITTVLFTIVLLIVLSMHIKEIKEKNARNFLLLVFKALEQKQKDIETAANKD